MFNKVILVGRISTDLELRQTITEKSYCKFNLAVNRMSEGTDFIPTTVWNKQAENLVKYQSKGSLILVEGSISMNNYTDKDGNNRTSFEVMGNSVQFLGSKKETSSIENLESDNAIEEEDPFTEFGNTVSIDDNFLE